MTKLSRLLALTRFTALCTVFISCASFAKDPWQYKLSLVYGVALEQGSWSLGAAPTAGSAQFSEQHKLTKLASQFASLGYRFISTNSWYIKGHYQLGQVWSGQYQQALHNTGQTNAYQSYVANANRGQQRNWSFAMGRQFKVLNKIGITPLIGYGRNASTYNYVQGDYSLCDATATPVSCSANLGAFANLNSEIKNSWRGPWYGLDLRWSPIPRWTLVAEWERQYTYYNADLKWNLDAQLQQPVSQTLSANGIGQRYGMGISYALQRPDTFLTFNFRQTKQNSSNGYSRKLLTSGGIIEQTMLSSQWQAAQWGLGISSKF
jgi:hypothetical protein